MQHHPILPTSQLTRLGTRLKRVSSAINSEGKENLTNRQGGWRPGHDWNALSEPAQLLQLLLWVEGVATQQFGGRVKLCEVASSFQRDSFHAQTIAGS